MAPLNSFNHAWPADVETSEMKQVLRVHLQFWVERLELAIDGLRPYHAQILQMKELSETIADRTRKTACSAEDCPVLNYVPVDATSPGPLVRKAAGF